MSLIAILFAVLAAFAGWRGGQEAWVAHLRAAGVLSILGAVVMWWAPALVLAFAVPSVYRGELPWIAIVVAMVTIALLSVPPSIASRP